MIRRQTDRRFIWLATLILLLAAALRLILIADVPPGLAQDEVLNADIVKFILGGEHALFFRHGFGHEALYHYFSVPFQVLLGDNVLAIRLPAAFLGMVMIALTMRWAKRDYGTVAALLAGLGLAISWWAIVFSRVGIRPMLEPVLLVAAVLAWPKKPWIAGVLLGLSIYSYTAARYIFLLPMGMLIYLAIFHRHGQTLNRLQPKSFRSIRAALIVFLISLAFFIPLALTLRADPTLQQRMDQLSGPLDELSQGNLQPVLSMAMATLGVFSFTGDPRWTYSLPGRPLFDPLTAVFFLLGAAIVIWRWRRPKYALLIIWSILAMLPSILSPDAPSTIRLIGLMPVVYLMAGISAELLWSRWQAWSGRRRQYRAILVYMPWLLLGVIVGVNLWRTVEDGFIRWPKATETRLKYQSVTQEIARHWQQDGEPTLVVTEPFYEPIDADSLRRNLGYDPGARWVQSGPNVAGAIVIPANGEDASVYVPEYAPLPRELLEAAGLETEPSYRSKGDPSFAVHAYVGNGANPTSAVDVTLDDKITLLGHDVLLANEEEIRLLTYWRVEDDLAPDLAAFVHLLDGDGAIAAQHDGLDVAPQSLQPGDVVVQYHILSDQDSFGSGPFALQVGMYQRVDGRRLIHAGTLADRITIVDELILTKE